jgi:hypothetical protein
MSRRLFPDQISGSRVHLALLGCPWPPEEETWDLLLRKPSGRGRRIISCGTLGSLQEALDAPSLAFLWSPWLFLGALGFQKRKEQFFLGC